MSENATERLARVLSMVPYIARRPGVAVEVLADEFGVSTAQIGKDLDLLMVCGLPGYYPDDLIDVVLSDDGTEVSIGFDAGIERPVRLTAEEAIALTVALRALGDSSGLVAGDAVHTALAKLEGGVTVPAVASVHVVPGDDAPALATVRSALEAGKQLWMRYYTASRDEVTERVVDPIRAVMTDGHSYLEAYCHRASAVRHFRIDRIEDARVLPEDAQAPLWVDADVPERMYHPDPQKPSVTLLLEPQARWVSEYYLMDEITEVTEDDQPTGQVRVRLHVADDEWLVRLVLSLGAAARIEDRPDLAALVADRAADALAQYA
jgi:proteasome accessory factor C